MAAERRGKIKPRFNAKQMAFMRSYVVNQNATQAAIEAGYSKKTAYSQGQRLLKKVEVKSMIDSVIAKVAERQQVRAEEVIAHTKYIGLSNMFDYILYDDDGHPYFDLKKIEKRDFMVGAAVSSTKIRRYETTSENGDITVTTETEVKLHDKKSALKMLGEATGAFTKLSPGISEAPKVEMHLHTHIPGSPGSKIRRPDPMLTDETMNSSAYPNAGS